MFLREILDLVIPLKIELKKSFTLNDLLNTLESTQEEVSLLINHKREVLSRATSIEEFRSDIDKISDAMAIMALILPKGVSLFGSNYNAVHPEEEEKKKKRRRKKLGSTQFQNNNERNTAEKRPLFKRKRRLGNTNRIFQRT